MKKIILLLSIVFASVLTIDAQILTPTGDTIINTATVNMDQKVQGGAETVTIQAIVTKVSGTVAGTVILKGSLDGTNFETIATADTLTLTNVTSQNHHWVVTNNPYLYYRVAGTGSGTMAAILSGYVLKRE